jgi:transcription elongation factor GreB
MSKAFTRESDDLPELRPLTRRPSALPFGAKNYMTVEGVQRLREELDRLVNFERPGIAASADDPNAQGQHQLLNARILHLQQSLESAVVVPVPATPEERVRFGAKVTVRDRGGSLSHYRIVGVDETDIDRGWVSWLSPIAKALLSKRPGESVRLMSPSGEQELEIIRVAYE